jgi:hypothetical protein
MTTVRIARPVKYKGVVYAANVDIPVDESDVKDLLKRGGWIINQEASAKQPGTEESDDAKGDAVGNTGTENTGSSDADGDGNSNADANVDGNGTDSNTKDDNGADAASGDAKEDELSELREYAEALGIEVKKTWGIAKLKKEIAAAETK